MRPISFGTTWWGKAWVDALEQRARLDPNRLPRGRTYARKGLVRSLDLSPGEIRSRVQGTRTTPYAVHVRIREFADDEWDRLLDAVAARAVHAAALLEGELDPAILDDAAGVGVALLPGAGELQPRCSCPDDADPCKHSAAVCYLVAGELDRDPFSLLLLRGRSRDRVLAELRSRRSSRARSSAGSAGADGPATGIDPGITAREAWERPLGELPAAPPRRDAPGHAVPLSTDPPARLGFTAASLGALVDDAAVRAWHALRGDGDLGLGTPAEVDLARRAEAVLDTDGTSALAERAGVRPRDLLRDAIAWREGGAAGVQAMQEEAWTPPLSEMAAARDAVLASGASPSQVRVRNNTVTIAGRTQLRLSRDGCWYRLDKEGGRWGLSAPPADQADDLLFRSAEA